MPVIEALTGGGKALIPKTATLTSCRTTIVFDIKAIVFNIKTIHSYIKAFKKASQTM